MKIKTLRFGQLEIDPQTVVTLPEGLVGLSDLKRFCLVETSPDRPLKWFQALDDPGLAFVIANPYLFCPDYSFEVSDEDLSFLGIESPEEVAIFVLLTIAGQGREVTANLVAPVVISSRTRKGKQVILNDPRYTTRHPLLPVLAQPAKVAN
jgi:flagellar assembly factor FliW